MTVRKSVSHILLSILCVVLVCVIASIRTQSTNTIIRTEPHADKKIITDVETSKKDRPHASPRQLSAIFSPPRARTATQAPKPVSENTKVNESIPSLQYIGKITDNNGIERLYVKDALSGKVFRVRTNGSDESGTRLSKRNDIGYFVTIDGKDYHVVGDYK